MTRATIPVVVEVCEDPASLTGRRTLDLSLARGSTVRDAARMVGLEGPVAAVLNGQDLTLEPDLGAATLLVPGDRLFLAPAPAEPTTIILAVVAAVSTIASIVLLPKIGKIESGRGAERRSLFDRYSRDAVAGDRIPVALGRRERHGGRVVAVVPFNGPAGESKMRILVDLGHGELGAIGNQAADFDRLVPGDGPGEVSGVYLNNQPAGNFDGVFLWGRTGRAGQAPIPGFRDTEVLRSVGSGGFTLANTSGSDRTSPSPSAEAELFTTQTGGSGVDALVLRLRFPQGLFAADSSGRPQPRAVAYRYRVRPTGGAWGAWTERTIERAEQSAFFAEERIDGLDPADGDLDVQLERITAEPSSLSTRDEIVWDSILEVAYAENAYEYATGDGGNALLAVEVTASETLSGDTPAVSVEVDGVRVRRWDRSSAADAVDPWDASFGTSSNPGDLALALLENVRWGLGAQFGLESVDLASLFDWIAYCEEDVERYAGGPTRPRFEFNYTLSEATEGLELLRMICRAGRATPSIVGGVWRFVVDRPQLVAREVFGEGSIVEGDDGLVMRYDLTTGGLLAPNRLVAEIESAPLAGESETVAFPADPGDPLIAGEPVREGSVQLDGVTDPDQALAELIYSWKRIRSEVRSVTLRTSHAFPRCVPGERFDLATSVVGYGTFSGRASTASTSSSIVFDGEPELDGGTTYRVGVVMADGSTVFREVSSVAQAGGVTTLSLASALPADPPADAELFLGEHGIEVKPFICEAIELDREALVWTVKGREYVPSVFDDTPDAAPEAVAYGTLRGRSVPPGQVLDLVASLEIVGGLPRVRLAWRQDPADASRTGSFSVYRRGEGESSWRLEPTRVVGNSAVVTDIDQGRTEQFAVVAVSPDGVQLSPAFAAQAVFSVTTEGGEAVEPLDAPTGVAVGASGDGQEATVDRVDGAASYRLEILEAPSSAIGDEHVRAFVARSIPQPGAGDAVAASLAFLPGVATTVLARSVNASGRPSLGFAEATYTAPVPAGESVSASIDFDLSAVGGDDEEGYQNLAWNASEGRLEPVDPSAPWSWTSGIEPLSASSQTHRLRARALVQQAPEAITIGAAAFPCGSAEGDQWRAGSSGPASTELRLFAPPVPVEAVDLRLFVRWRDPGSGELSAWTFLEHLGELTVDTTEVQLRVEGSRSRYPYALALTEARLVATR